VYGSYDYDGRYDERVLICSRFQQLKVKLSEQHLPQRLLAGQQHLHLSWHDPSQLPTLLHA